MAEVIVVKFCMQTTPQVGVVRVTWPIKIFSPIISLELVKLGT